MITLFHNPSVAASTRALTILKQASAHASTTSTEDQASDHSHQNKVQRSEFQLDVTEDPPTPDQVKSILEFVGSGKVGSVVQGANSVSDAVAKLKNDQKAFQRPVVCLLSSSTVLMYRATADMIIDGRLECWQSR